MADEEEVEDGDGTHGDVEAGVHLAQRAAQRPPSQQLHGSARQHH